MLTSRHVPLAIFFLLLFAYAYVNQGWGWNQNARLDLLHAIVVRHTVAIDAYEENTGDKEHLNGHIYSEKAPGLAAIAFPTFVLTFLVLRRLGIDIDGDAGWKISERITTAGSVGLLAALGGMCLFLFLRRRIGPQYAFVTVLAVFLGSLPFPYATMMFSHGATIGLFAAMLWLFDAGRDRKHSAPWQDYLLGFLAGLAVATEYPSAIGVAILFVLVLLPFGSAQDRRGWRHAARFVAGAAAPLSLIPGYNWIVSGSFIDLGYARVDFPGMQDGFFGVTLPRGEAVQALLFSQFRGLFFWSPFLLLSAVGYPVLYRASRQLFWTTVLVPVAYVLFAASYAYWDGGFAFGPRHLSAAIPFLAVASAYGLTVLPRTGVTFGGFSILLVSFATFVNAAPPNEFEQPLFAFYPREFLDGKMAWNLGRALGLPGGWSILLWAVIIAYASAAILRAMALPHIVTAPSTRRLPVSPAVSLRNHWHAARRSVRSGITRVFPYASPVRFLRAARRAGLFRCTLWALLIAGLTLRFVHLPFMEFKGDEFEAMVLAYRHAHGVEFAKTSIASSVGIMNPPFFVWLLSIPALFTSDPILLTAFVAVLNVAGMLLLYVFLRRTFSGDTALWTTALLATAPWAVIYSRKLWPQDVMILFLVLFYFACAALMRRHRPWHVYLLFFSLAALTQLHLIAWLIPLVLVVFFDVFRITMRRRDVIGGLIIFVLLYVPYALFHLGTSFENLLSFLGNPWQAADAQGVFDHLAWSVAATSGLRFAVHIGERAYDLFASSPLIIASLVFFYLYAIGTVAAALYFAVQAVRNASMLLRPSTIRMPDRILLLLTAIYVTLVGVYIVMGAPAYTQYHIIFYPLAPLLFVLGLQQALKTGLLPGVVLRSALLLIVLSHVCFTASFLVALARSPETIDGGYGKPYVLKQDEWRQKLNAAFAE